MKYIPVQETIPQSKRQEFNEKIVYLIDSDTAVVEEAHAMIAAAIAKYC